MLLLRRIVESPFQYPVGGEFPQECRSCKLAVRLKELEINVYYAV